MPIFNFKKFINESEEYLRPSEAKAKENAKILEELLEDLITMHRDELNLDPRRFNSTDSYEVEWGNLVLRRVSTLQPGETLSILKMTYTWRDQVPESEIFAFGIRYYKRYDSIYKRAIELFRRQTGIELLTYINDERQMILAEPEVIKFVTKLLNFEFALEELEYRLPWQYTKSVELISGDEPTDIEISFPTKDNSLSLKGCYLDTTLKRGVVVGGDLPIDTKVKYTFKIKGLWNHMQERDNPSIKELGNKLKDYEKEFEFFLDDTDESQEELIKFIDKEILSKIETPETILFKKVKKELQKLKQYQIRVEIGEINISEKEHIELNLNWKGNQYTIYLLLNQLGQHRLEGIITISQFDTAIEKSTPEDLAETIYLCLLDGKLKISQ